MFGVVCCWDVRLACLGSPLWYSISQADVTKGVFSNKPFKILLWNINGLLSKLSNKNFTSYVRSFDVICIVETFLERFDAGMLSDFTSFCKPAIKLSKHGRMSGGLVCLIRNEYASHVRFIDVHYSNFMVFLIDKSVFRTLKDILYVCVYIPPEGSPFYSTFDISNGIDLLEECLSDCLLEFSDVYIVMSGDFNSRTANISPDVAFNSDFTSSLNKSSSIDVNRNLQDMILNNFGKRLLNLCITFNLSILNGVCNGDRQGCYTFIAESGSSVNDYFIVSADLFGVLESICKLNVRDRFESDHMPLELFIHNLDTTSENNAVRTGREEKINKIVWNEDLSQTFSDAMQSADAIKMMDLALTLIDSDIDEALHVFNSCILLSAQCMKKTINTCNDRKTNDWYDQECRTARTNLRKLYRVARRSGNPSDQHNFCVARREYKHLLKNKEKDFHKSILDRSISSVRNQKQFWENVHSFFPKRNFVKNNITVEEWFEHFKLLLERDSEAEEETVTEESDSYFNRPISKEEILIALRKIKRKKAAGPDGIIGELLKNAGGGVIHFFVQFFNALFQKGIFPDKWSEGIVLPLHKKGDVNNPNNYRGITISDVSSKIFSAVINNRLQEWVEEHNITGEHQAGFKKNYSTIDHMFTLLAFIQKQFSLGRKLYVAFIDFEKAFDSVNRNILWPILVKKMGLKVNCTVVFVVCIKVLE